MDPVQKGANIPRKKNVLGRGLQALMSSSVSVPVEFASTRIDVTNIEVAEVAETKKAAFSSFSDSAKSVATKREIASGAGLSEGGPLEGGLIYLSIDRIFPNKLQPRQFFKQDDIDKLAESIRASGLLQPIVVRRRGHEAGPLATYEIIAGERRWRAARQAGLLKVPAILKQISDREALELGIIENVQRSDLNAIEEAIAYQRLSEDFGATQAEIASTVGKDRASIANALRLLKLPESVKKLVISGELSAGHGRAILSLESEKSQIALAERIVKEGLSVRSAEEISTAGKPASLKALVKAKLKKPEVGKAVSTLALEERLRRALGTKVNLTLSPEGEGELKISFFSKAELERILEKLGA